MEGKYGSLDSTPSAPMFDEPGSGQDQVHGMMPQPYMAQSHPPMPQPYFQGQNSDHFQERLPPPYSESDPQSIPQTFTNPPPIPQYFREVQQQAAPRPQPPVIYPTPRFGEYNQQVICPACRTAIVTKIRPRVGLMSWFGSVVCCLFGCVLGCCLIPCCVDSCQDVDHFCPNCKILLGRFRRGCC